MASTTKFWDHRRATILMMSEMAKQISDIALIDVCVSLSESEGNSCPLQSAPESGQYRALPVREESYAILFCERGLPAQIKK